MSVQEDGVLGSSAYFNGTDGYVEMPDDVIYGLHNMTISTWVKPESLGNWARIFDFGSELDPPYPNLFLTVNSGNNNMRLAFETGDSSQINAGAILQTGQWQHLAVVINGVTASLYLNGEEVGTASDFQFVPMLISNMTSNLLGKSHYTADSYFQGSMDDFRIYNRALSASEITMLSNGEEPVREIQTVSDPEDVETTAGVAPVLPEKANVTYADGTNGTEPIVWEDIPEENYAQAGTFTVKGTVGTFEVEITVTVKEEEEPEEPELTELQVTAIYSDGTTKDVTSDAEISGFDSETAGEKIITVSYGELDTSFTVTVEEKEDPTEPSDPGDPSDPSDPTDPGSPSDPADPTGPADPSLPSDGGQGDGAGTANPEEQTAVQTGDSLRLTPYLAALILAGTVSGIILIRKKKGEKTIRICQSELPVSKKENRG